MKKFYLVNASELREKYESDSKPPLETVNSNNLYHERTKPLITKELHQIDKVMASVLNNNTLSEDEKVRDYNKALSEYIALKESTSIKPNITNSTTKQLSTSEESYNPISGISSRYQDKANRLWGVIKNNDNLKVFSNGEVSINNERLQGSNLTDLISKAVNPLPKNLDVTGWNRFREILIDNNVPRVLINKKVVDRRYPITKRTTFRSPSKLLDTGDIWIPFDGKAKKKPPQRKKQIPPY